MDFDICEYCLHEESKLACGQCEKSHYCSKECQERHWIESHHNECDIDAPFKQLRRQKTDWQGNLGGLVGAILKHVGAVADIALLSTEPTSSQIVDYVKQNKNLSDTAQSVASYLGKIKKMQDQIRIADLKAVSGDAVFAVLAAVVWDIVKYAHKISRMAALNQQLPSGGDVFTSKTTDDLWSALGSLIIDNDDLRNKLYTFFITEEMFEFLIYASSRKSNLETTRQILGFVKDARVIGKQMDDYFYAYGKQTKKMLK